MPILLQWPETCEWRFMRCEVVIKNWGYITPRMDMWGENRAEIITRMQHTSLLSICVSPYTFTPPQTSRALCITLTSRTWRFTSITCDDLFTMCSILRHASERTMPSNEVSEVKPTAVQQSVKTPINDAIRLQQSENTKDYEVWKRHATSHKMSCKFSVGITLKLKMLYMKKTPNRRAIRTFPTWSAFGR